ncbi:TPA: hypothetical protein N2Z33_004388 [Citrobacter freundii]|uniref:hypothetical protein n=1 Tax=Citrobacter freundii TaxID=546 RepID=UPI0029505A9D|nr:hypothetical protein [Citrobacter freundii]HCL8275060.1 hypothetical protein [Citrobacter freundii]
MVLLLLMLPTYYVNAQNICVDYKTDLQVDVKYILTIKRKIDFVEYNDVIEVTKYDHKIIQVFEIKKTIPEIKKDKPSTKYDILDNTKLYINMYSTDNIDLNKKTDFNCIYIELNNKRNKKITTLIDNDIVVEFRTR